MAEHNAAPATHPWLATRERPPGSGWPRWTVSRLRAAWEGTPRRALTVCLAVIVLTGVLLVAWLAGRSPRSASAGSVAVSARPDPPSRADLAPPPVPPLLLKPLPVESARAINAAVGVSALANPAASAFVAAGSEASRARAADCLATAAYYEAGDDDRGQRAVMQVVLNRARHSAFPATVCGVVFQGSERRTGCQFTFTCDGAFAARTPSRAAWERARARAAEALGGYVFAPVGLATHYHTDWVVPYWSASLDKVAIVDTHLFYRWQGRWGRPPAFAARRGTEEPVVPALARLSPAHASGIAAVTTTDQAADVSPTAPETAAVAPGEAAPQVSPGIPAGDDGVHLIAIDPKAFPGSYALQALRLCGSRSFCKVLGWTDAGSIPADRRVTAAAAADLAFVYVQDGRRRANRSLWNCRSIKRDNPAHCLPTDAAALDVLVGLAPMSTAGAGVITGGA